MKTVLLVTWLGLLQAFRRDISSEQSRLVSCVTAAVRQHFIPHQALVISGTGNEDELLTLLLKHIEHSFLSVQVSRPGSSLAERVGRHYEKIGSYVILTSSTGDIEEQANHLISSASWNNEARFLIVTALPVDNPQQEALSVMKEAWDDMRALNIVVLIQVETEFRFYTWFPYQSYERCEDVKDAVILNRWTWKNGGEFVSNEPLFPYKLPKNFKGCPLKAVTPYHDTFEARYLTGFLSGLNFTIEIDSKYWEIYVELEIVIRKAFEDVLFGRAEVAFGAIPLYKEAADLADPSVPYYESKYEWYVPCAKPFSRLEAISHIFSLPVWVTLVASMLVVAVVTWSLARRSLESHAYTTASTVLYNVWAVVVGVSVTEMPRTSRLRVVIFPWIWYCFAVSTVFQTFFTSYLVDPGLQKQITSVEELLESGIEFGFRPDIRLYYEKSPYKIHRDLLNRYVHCKQTHLCIDRIIETGFFATVAESWAVEKHLNNLHEADRALVCRMNDFDSFPIRIVTYFSKSSFLLDTFNKILTSIVESGLNIKADQERKHGVTSNIFGVKGTEEEYFVFTTAHLLIAFCALLVGHVLSCVVFLCELLHHKSCSNHSRSQ
jgi:hypothetical protein